MRLRGVEFGNVWGQSGVQGFFGEGYPYHKFWKAFGLTFKGCTLVSKTTTVPPRVGKMPLKADGITPREWIPKCIYLDLLKGLVLNAVSLSGPGFEALLNMDRWRQLLHPFMISYMSAETTVEKRLEETRQFVRIMSEHLPFRAPVAIQRNYSCPNVGTTPRPENEFLDEVIRDLVILGRLTLPIVVKLSVTTPPKLAWQIAQCQECDCVLVSNTIPWGAMKDKIDWKVLFGTEVSPLQARVGMDGGLSGWPLLNLTIEWVREALNLRFPVPIAAGGGILGPRDGIRMAMSGAKAVCIGSMTILRPWRVQDTIDACNEEFRQQRGYMF